MHNHLQRIMNLVRRTGDRVIVTDAHNPDDSFVLMSFEDYELLMEDRFDAIGGVDWEDGEYDEAAPGADVSQSTDFEPIGDVSDEGAWYGEIPPEAFVEEQSEESTETLDNDTGYGTIRTAEEEGPKKRKNWQIPPEIKRGSEAVEEDRYYLENV